MLMAAHPVRIVNQRADYLLIQSSCGTEVDVFDARWALQPAFSEPPLQCPILTPVPLSVHQQRQALLEAELRRVGVFLLLRESFRHAAQAHGMQLLNGLLVEHGFSFWTY